jgi:hypothetical protein
MPLAPRPPMLRSWASGFPPVSKLATKAPVSDNDEILVSRFRELRGSALLACNARRRYADSQPPRFAGH